MQGILGKFENTKNNSIKIVTSMGKAIKKLQTIIVKDTKTITKALKPQIQFLNQFKAHK